MTEPVSGTGHKGQQSIETNADPDEVARFSALADEWWDPDGSFKPLHRLNPARLGFIRDQLARRFGRDITSRRPFDGLTMLDIGCGGGLVCEPLSRLGARVTGIDASERNIGTAGTHAENMALDIEYRHMTAENLVEQDAQFDVVLSLEVIEHVPDINRFLSSCGALVKPGGALILSTLNRTAKSFLFGKVAAEYVLGWVPRGTHQWKRFVRPSEISAGLRGSNLRISDISGLSYDLKSGEWAVGRDVSVNYMVFAEKNE
ncbi:MAG: bifunctional 2-polyprenyl-6-hydroxyphenol methylase/3-demethylubiquinol 3-O-methyltransferase UbiG [Rhodospirillales bacterium]|nr:bifunctional 2-polyprenyl-6-hydroxyphenol methylase/3-demethylubiquinol 3-O-methyltransferase UbiG [Rhodospirillales bacterium]